jgi:hypothetical protein
MALPYVFIFVLLLAPSCSTKSTNVLVPDERPEIPLTIESDQILIDETFDGASIDPILDEKIYALLSKYDAEYGCVVVDVEQILEADEDPEELDLTQTCGGHQYYPVDEDRNQVIYVPTFLGLAI